MASAAAGTQGQNRADTSNVSSLAGLVQAVSGEAYAFAMWVEGCAGSPEPARRLRARIVDRLVGG